MIAKTDGQGSLFDPQHELGRVETVVATDGGVVAVAKLNDRGARVVAAMKERATDQEREAAIVVVKREVEPHLLALAKARVGWAAKDAGVTADDFRAIAERIPQAALVGSKPRSWSWVGPHLAGLARARKLGAFFIEGVPVSRRSKLRDESHGNAHRVYLHPDDPRITGGPRSQTAEP